MDCFTSWRSGKASVRSHGIAGFGLFASAGIEVGEVVAIKAGRVLTASQCQESLVRDRHVELQLADDLYLGALTALELRQSMLYINHSCDPNLGFDGNVVVRAIRPISAGVELTLDYATYMADEDFLLECRCGNATCRRVVTGSDWRLASVQTRYQGFFTTYVQHLIDRADHVSAANAA